MNQIGCMTKLVATGQAVARRFAPAFRAFLTFSSFSPVKLAYAFGNLLCCLMIVRDLH